MTIPHKKIPSLMTGSFKSGESFNIHLLNIDWLDDISDVFSKTVTDLEDTEKAYLLPKNRGYFESHLNTGGSILGVVTGDKLIAIALVREPSAENPETGMVDFTVNAPPDTLTLLQCVAVDPDYQGCKLGQHMVKTWLMLAALKGKEHAIAEVEISNIASLKAFLNNGISITSTGTDPSDGVKVFNLYENVKTALLKSAFNTSAPKPEQDHKVISLDGHKRKSALAWK